MLHYLLASLDFRCVSFGVNSTASLFYRLRQPRQVFERMKLSLPGKTQRCTSSQKSSAITQLGVVFG